MRADTKLMILAAMTVIAGATFGIEFYIKYRNNAAYTGSWCNGFWSGVLLACGISAFEQIIRTRRGAAPKVECRRVS